MHSACETQPDGLWVVGGQELSGDRVQLGHQLGRGQGGLPDSGTVVAPLDAVEKPCVKHAPLPQPPCMYRKPTGWPPIRVEPTDTQS
jgi:hypothetical protein